MTLVSIITRDYEYGKSVIKDCLEKAQFEKVVIFTNEPESFKEFTTIKVDCRPYKQWCVWRLTEFPKFRSLFSNHILNIETDARIVRPKAWDDIFYNYDYIGAKWSDGVVGNGGFTLISNKFLEILRELELPKNVNLLHACDYFMCRNLRFKMEDLGMKYAPIEIADRFANETGEYLGAWGIHGKAMLIKIALLTEPNWEIRGDGYTITPHLLCIKKTMVHNIKMEQIFIKHNLYGKVLHSVNSQMVVFNPVGREPAFCYKIEAVKLPLTIRSLA